MAKSPAFSFYANDFLTGTATMSLAERGAYVTLLAHQWDAGTVPGHDLRQMSRLLGCTPAQARTLWAVIAGKFEPNPDGDGFVNKRLEDERAKQRERRQKLAQNGSKGGATTQAKKQQLLQQEGQQNSSLSSSSTSSCTGTNDTYCAAETASRFPKAVPHTRAKASTWKRALAIAHAVIDTWPKNPENWTYETKGRMLEQHLDPDARSPRGGRMFGDAVDYARQQRLERAAKGAVAS